MDSKQPNELEEALDTAIARLQRGEPTESCRPADQDLAAELAPLLGVAQNLRELAADAASHKPSLKAGKERFLQQADLLAREASRRREPIRSRLRLGIPVAQPLSNLFAPLLRRGAATAVVLVALLAVLLTGTTMMTSTSAASIPGDTLYPVKRAAESVRLALTFDRNARVAFEQAIEQRRVREAQAVLQRHRQTTVAFRAVVQAFEGATLHAAGLAIDILPTTRLSGPPPSAGRVIAIVARTEAEGRLVAQSIDTLEVTPYPIQLAGYPTATPARAASPIAAPHAPTTDQASTPTLEPSPEPTSTEKPSLTPSATTASTETPTATADWPGHGRGVLQINGLIETLEPERWQVAGYEIVVTANTRLSERAGKAEVGAWARIQATREGDGKIVARRIVIERPSEKALEAVQFVGIIEKMGKSTWRIAGETVEIGPKTKTVGRAQVGSVALVEGHRGSSGALLADRIRAFKLPGVTGLEGAIEEIDDDRWVVAGRPVRLAKHAVLVGEAGVGLQAEIAGYEEPDGTLCALLVRITGEAKEDAATPTATSTQSPTAEPSPTATLGNEQLTPEPSLTATSKSEQPTAEPSLTATPEDERPTPSSRGRRPRRPRRNRTPGPPASPSPTPEPEP